MTVAADVSPALNEDRTALADLARRERFLDELAAALADRRCVKLVLGKPRGAASDLQRLTARPIDLKGETCLNLVWRHSTRDITKNPPLAEGLALLRELLGTAFSHAHLFTTTEEVQLMISKRGKVGLTRQAVQGADAAAAPAAAQEHNREKHRLLSLALPFLEDLGVTDGRHRLVPAMARKWKQINKFLEVLASALDKAQFRPADGRIHVVDFGSGKGYLTFALHHYLAHSRGLDAQVAGVEWRQDMVTLCNAAAQRRSMAGLQFLCGDVRSHVPERLDVMIALHACDTATDFALHTAIRAQAAIVLCSPCCHKQIRPQMHLPTPLAPMLQHGIHLGQQAEMVTDSLRSLLLEAQGYDAQVFEFVALEHTSKNKMILAVRRAADAPDEDARRALAREQISQIKAFYGIAEHCLETMLAAPQPA
jgi:SAM-dependent methyltransferase